MSETGKVGVWFIGALGNVATCTVAGVRGICHDRFSRAGLTTELREFGSLALTPLEDLVFGGWDIRLGDPLESAREIHRRSGAIPDDLITKLESELHAFGADVRPGISLNCGAAIEALQPRPETQNGHSLEERVHQLQNDLREFQARHQLREVVVVNVASTEPYAEPCDAYADLASLRSAIGGNQRDGIDASVIYAYAAIDAGFPYVNFTPASGASIPALQELALERAIPHAGRDGKTGETLVKTVLAPMFAARNFAVMSWSGFNILGNRDGQVLNEPANNEAKIRNKDGVLNSLLPNAETPQSLTRIHYVESLDDWKTAWDFIHFRGFMDVKMSLQFTWQGCDSVLAAPLVIDLVRLADFAHRNGESGPMAQTALFFKSPLGTDEQDFHRQVELLQAYAAGHSQDTNDPKTC